MGKRRSEQPDAADLAVQQALKERGEIPGHVAIIMDGNGRWAKERGYPRVQGHQEGAASVRDIAEASAQLGINVLTLYTFSTENWHRPLTEVNALMQLLIRTLRKEAETLHRNQIRLSAIGDLEKLPDVALRELQDVCESTATHERMTINLALSYSGRWDLVRAARRIAQDVASGRLAPDDVDDDALASRLTTAELPDPDLLIRTGGDYRISNFLLWESAYTEFHFTSVFWPGFRRANLYDAVRDFQDRDRRFGRVHEEART
ncbi:MAG: isoprenyl transferase [Rhodothermales bacterium]|nr:isoprenyl transferase [Rhodothermales bacterium]MBO6779808.1 isoprenyl transferase [Rhodothermales bacterium]